METTKLTEYTTDAGHTHLEVDSNNAYQSQHSNATSTTTTISEAVDTCATTSTLSTTTTAGAAITPNKTECSAHLSPFRKKCDELVDNNTHTLMDIVAATQATLHSTTTSPVTTLQTSDLSRDHWYAHHHHHPNAHPAHHHHAHHTHHHHHHAHHQQLAEELAMYGPATTATIGKYGLENTTDGYLNARYNVNVKGVRHERTSSFFDIPAVTHPYCYRFPASPPAGILKKSDEEPTFCNLTTANASSTALQLGHSFHNTKIEHPADSTTTHLNTQNNHHQHQHQPLHSTHTSHAQISDLHHSHPHHHHHHNAIHTAAASPTHLGTHASAFKFNQTGVISSSGPSIYQHYQHNPQSATCYSLRTSAQLSPTLSSLSTTTPTAGEDLKYESAYNATISSTYALRPNIVDSTTVTSTDTDLRIDSLYPCNTITTSQTVNQRRGSLQLWQFLVALLDEPTTSSSCIAWTGRGMEFKLIEPEEVARRWGIQKNRPAMNYDKLSRSLRYYYEKGIMQKVNGERYVYRFVCDPDALFNMAYGHLSSATNTKNDHMLNATTALSLAKCNENADTLNRTNGNIEHELNRDRHLTQLGNGNFVSTLHKYQ